MVLLRVLKNLPRIASVGGASKNPIQDLQGALRSREVGSIVTTLEKAISSKEQLSRLRTALSAMQDPRLGQLVSPVTKPALAVVTGVRDGMKKTEQEEIILPFKNLGRKR